MPDGTSTGSCGDSADIESGCLSWHPAIYGEDEQRYCKGALCNQHVPRDQSRVIAKENKAREENFSNRGN